MKIKISNTNSVASTPRDATIKNVLTIIPKKTENKTKFFLYSFLRGRKKVTNKPGREKSRMQ